ncbi:hypothetical protein XH79_21125 [Bradyrhizobium sp. CCBAU 45389]|nr:hypothetical protein [Bradyrhizobium sp. CCBAU 45389]
MGLRHFVAIAEGEVQGGSGNRCFCQEFAALPPPLAGDSLTGLHRCRRWAKAAKPRDVQRELG